MKTQLLYQAECTTGEGITWLECAKKLLWVDIEGKTLYERDYKSEEIKTHHFDRMVTTIIPSNQNEELIILALENRLISYNLSTQEQNTLLAIPTDEGQLRTNDGKCSTEGRIWLGVMSFTNHDETGFLYRIDPDLTVTKVLDKQCIPNGIVWDSTGEYLFYNDSGKRTITRYNYNQEDGSITHPKVIVQVPEEYGVPDGMTIDTEDNLWVAHWGGSAVYVWDSKTGEGIEKIDVPVPNIASCTFGGLEHKTLYITTARAGLSDEELEQYPLSGSVFYVNTKSRGGVNHYPF